LASLFGDRPDSIRSDGGGVGGAGVVARRSAGGLGGAGGGASVPLGAQELRVGNLLSLSFPSQASDLVLDEMRDVNVGDFGCSASLRQAIVHRYTNRCHDTYVFSFSLFKEYFLYLLIVSSLPC